MKIEIKHIIKLITLFFCLLPGWTWAATYKVSTSTKTVDGDTFCGGSTCTSTDTIIIAGGARGDLLFKDFDGNGSYITITNEATDRVIITENGDVNRGVLSIQDCKYIDLRGDGSSSHSWSKGCKSAGCYGIVAINDGIPHSAVGTVWVWGKSNHVKLSYIEVYHTGVTWGSSVGIKVQDNALPSAWTFSDFEIHHNYIHDTRYHGMYLGHNNPAYTGDGQECANGCPYVADFSIHDNLLENLGASGFTYKGVKTGSVENHIYNNTIKTTGLIWGLKENGGGISITGISLPYFYGTSYAEVYGNWIEKSFGPGMNVIKAPHIIRDNIILGCGTGADNPPEAWNVNRWSHGIYLQKWNSNTTGDPTIQIYDNIIVEPKRFGISDHQGGRGVKALMQRNIIAEAESGEYENENGGVTEGIKDNANIYEADADDVGFKVWIDDGDYGNDDFSLNNKKPGDKVKVVQNFRINK